MFIEGMGVKGIVRGEWGGQRAGSAPGAYAMSSRRDAQSASDTFVCGYRSIGRALRVPTVIGLAACVAKARATMPSLFTPLFAVIPSEAVERSQEKRASTTTGTRGTTLLVAG